MCDPVPYGLPTNFCLSEKECNTFIIPLYFSKLPVEKWLDFNAVSKLIIENVAAPPKQANKILTSFISDLNRIKSQKRTRFNLFNYCTDVMDHSKINDSMKAFYVSCNEELSLSQDKKRQQYLVQKSADLVTERVLLDNIENLKNDLYSREGCQMNESSSSRETLLSGENNYKSVLVRIVEFRAKLHQRYIQGDAISEQETDIMK